MGRKKKKTLSGVVQLKVEKINNNGLTRKSITNDTKHKIFDLFS
jgi:hypothetical protein